ncbi:MAG: methyltransferase [Deltaproteobacteria bacterium]|nr:methyltransferase [Deltaproteobacteria bacterium]
MPVAWEKDYPAVARVLRNLTQDQIDAYESQPSDFTDMPEPFGQWASQALGYSSWPELETNRPAIDGLKRPRRVPGRKWEQVKHFTAAVIAHHPRKRSIWLDWCAGKGHLGRTLSELTASPVRCIESDLRLCQQGGELADRAGLEVEFVNADVLETDLTDEFNVGGGVVALHACGQLHMQLIVQAVRHSIDFLAVAPCCYHRIAGQHYRPMSQAAQKLSLEFGKHHLRLVAFDEVVATQGRKNIRRREQAWRLGLDLMLREASGDDRYRSLGPVPRAWLTGSFESFCHKLAERELLSMPTGFDAAKAERDGWQRLVTVRALGLVRGLFRRPLESWLLLDRMLFLNESGYRVAGGTFCAPEVTPRNLMILASR